MVDRQLVDQRQVLVDGVDPVRSGVVDALGLVVLALHPHRAFVLLLEAADDLQQSRLAGAVVAEQSEHLALAQVEVDVTQGDRRTEALADVLDPQHIVVGRVRPDDVLSRKCRLSHGPTPGARAGRRR